MARVDIPDTHPALNTQPRRSPALVSSVMRPLLHTRWGQTMFRLITVLYATMVAALTLSACQNSGQSASRTTTAGASAAASGPVERPCGAQTVLPFTGIDRPMGVAVDNSGTVYVASLYNNLIWKLPTGSSTPTTLPFPDLIGPQGVAVDSAGSVYVLRGGDRTIQKLAQGTRTAATRTGSPAES